MMLDIAAIQYMYGANFNSNAGNTVYTFSTTTGEMFIDGVGQGTPQANRIFRTIWDGNGIDTYDLSNYTTDLQIDLAPGGWSVFDAGSAGAGQHHRRHPRPRQRVQRAAVQRRRALPDRERHRRQRRRHDQGQHREQRPGREWSATISCSGSTARRDTRHDLGGAGADVLDGGAGFDFASYGNVDGRGLGASDRSGTQYRRRRGRQLFVDRRPDRKRLRRFAWSATTTPIP